MVILKCIISRVGQNHIYTVHLRYFWQGNHQIYGVYIRFWPTLTISSLSRDKRAEPRSYKCAGSDTCKKQPFVLCSPRFSTTSDTCKKQPFVLCSPHFSTTFDTCKKQPFVLCSPRLSTTSDTCKKQPFVLCSPHLSTTRRTPAQPHRTSAQPHSTASPHFSTTCTRCFCPLMTFQ